MVGIAQASDFQIGVFAVLVLVTLAALIGDYYTTMVGLQHGGSEGNPVARWLFAKLASKSDPSQGQTLTAWLSCILVLFLAALISNYNLKASYFYLALVGGAEAIQVTRNYLKLKAENISLK